MTKQSPSWAKLAGGTLALYQEIDKYVSDKLPYLVEWLKAQGEEPENELRAKVVFKKEYRDRLEEFKRYYEERVAGRGGVAVQASSDSQTSGSVPSVAEQEGDAAAEPVEHGDESEATAGNEPGHGAGEEAVEVRGGEDLFVGIFGGAAPVAVPQKQGMIRVATVDEAEAGELRRVQAYLIAQMQEERTRPAWPKGEDYELRTYRIPPQALEKIKALGEDVRFGRLGMIRLMRAAIATAVYCVEERLPIYRIEPVTEAELILGVGHMDHSQSTKVNLWLPAELIRKMEQIRETTLLYPSDLAVMAAGQLIAFVENGQRKAERRRASNSGHRVD